jgi:hypothetical protein
LPLRECGNEIFQFEGQHRFEFSVGAAATALRGFFKLPHGLQTHFGIADFRSKPPDVAQGMVLFSKETASYLLAHQPQSCARFLQMLAHFVHRRVIRLHFVLGNGDGALDLFTANPAKIVAQSFAVS